MLRLKTIGIALYFGLILSCSNLDPELNSMDFLKAGDSLSVKTFDTLSRTLQKAITAGSFDEAILVCKEMAPGLTGTYNTNTTTISRTSLLVRNKANAPDKLEIPQLDFFNKMIEERQPLKSKLVVDEMGTVHYFKPILIQPLCLNCHGNEQQDILPALLAKIKKEYPADEATGYETGDLRGLWHITFNPFKTKK